MQRASGTIEALDDRSETLTAATLKSPLRKLGLRTGSLFSVGSDSLNHYEIAHAVV